MALLKAVVKPMTATGIVCYGSGHLVGLLVGTDYSNDPIISLYDNTSAAGDEVIPTTKVDASVFGFNGFMPGSIAIPFNVGLYLSLTNLGAGSAEIFIYYRLAGAGLPSKMIR